MSLTTNPARRDRALWVQCACTALVAVGAAYALYRHGQEFASRFGADQTTAAIWPLIVDGLLTTATVELLNRALKRHRAETVCETTNEIDETGTTGDETAPVVRLAVVSGESRSPTEPTAEQRMWAYFQTERSQGRTPTGAELDRIADTNNYGRRVLRRWKQEGRFGGGTAGRRLSDLARVGSS